MDELISRQAAIDVIEKFNCFGYIEEDADKLLKALNDLSPAQPEIIRCKDCIFGYLYMDVQNGVTDSWIECRNPEGLYRDVSVDGYCYASIRRM